MNWVTKYQVFDEETTTRKSDPNVILLLLAALGIMLIGLTITNVPIAYSESSSDGDDGGGDDDGGGNDDDESGGNDDDESGGNDDDESGGDDDDESGGDGECGDGGGDDESEDGGGDGECGDGEDGASEDGEDGASEDGASEDGASEDGGDAVPILGKVDKDKESKDDKEIKDDGLGGILQDKATALVTAAKAFGYGIPTPGPEKPTPTTKIYTNKTYGLSAIYPSDWRIDETDSDTNDGLTEVAQIYPSTHNDQKVEIGIEDHVTGLTLDGYLHSTTLMYQNNFGGIVVLESDAKSTLAGIPAYKIVFTPSDKSTQIMETGFIVGDKVYYMTYTAKPESYLSNLPDVQNIANSLKISK